MKSLRSVVSVSLLFHFGLCSLCSLCACATLPQEPGDLPKVTVGESTFHRRLLANGLHAVAVRDDGKGLSVFMVIGAGKRQETPETTGLAHLTEHAMYAGTARTGLGEHDKRIRAMGGESNAFTRTDYTLFYDHQFPAEKLTEVLTMEADRLRGLTFDEKSVLIERTSLSHEEARTWQPTDARQELLESRVYRKHAYGAGVLDEKGHTKAPGLEIPVIREFYDRYYQPDNTAVVVVGDLEAEAALDAIEGAFAHLPRGPKRPELPTEPDIESARTEELGSDLPRDRCNFVWLVPAMGDPARPALDVIARILSRRTSADKSPIEAVSGGRVDKELFQVAATGTKAKAELETLMQRCRDQLFSAAEVEEVKALLSDDFSSLPLRARPYFSLAGTFGVYEVLGHVHNLVGYEAAIQALSPEKLQAVARQHLDPHKQVTVIFESAGIAAKPLPDDPRALQTAAEEASESGDLDRAIAAYTKLLAMKPTKMFQVIYLSSRGQTKVKKKDFEGAIADYEKALEVVDYPAVRDLLREAKKLEEGKPTSKPTPPRKEK